MKYPFDLKDYIRAEVRVCQCPARGSRHHMHCRRCDMLLHSGLVCPDCLAEVIEEMNKNATVKKVMDQ